MMKTSEVFDAAALNAMIASATILGADVKMGLNTAIVGPSKVLTIADMVEPTYAGYVRQNVVFGAAFRDLQWEISALAGAVTWSQAGALTPTLIQGFFLVFGAGPAFLGYEALPTPFQMTDALDAVTIILQYIQSNATPGFATVLV